MAGEDRGYRAIFLQRVECAGERVAAVGGRLYLAKDSRMDPALLALMYPRLEEWREIRDKADPQHRFRSDLGRRLGLV